MIGVLAQLGERTVFGVKKGGKRAVCLLGSLVHPSMSLSVSLLLTLPLFLFFRYESTLIEQKAIFKYCNIHPTAWPKDFYGYNTHTPKKIKRDR